MCRGLSVRHPGDTMPALLHARPPTDPAEEHRLRKLAAARHAPASWIQHHHRQLGWRQRRRTRPAAGLPHQDGLQVAAPFNTGGIDGLADLPRPGVPRRISEHQRGRIIALARARPPGRLHQGGEGLQAPDQPEAPATWTLDTLAQAARAEGIGVGRSQVRRILLAERMRWRRTRSWTTSTDPDFAPKGPASSPSTPRRRPG